jgi:hypothetical protein
MRKKLRPKKSKPQAIPPNLEQQQLPNAQPTAAHAVASRTEPPHANGRSTQWRIRALKVAGWLITAYSVLAAWVSLRYDVSVSPYATMDPANPFKTVFVLTNESAFSIKKVNFTCSLKGMYAEDGIEQEQTPRPSGYVDLPGHGKIVFFCERTPEIHGTKFDPGAILAVDVSYHTAFPLWSPFEQRGSQKFLLMETEYEHHYIWAPEKPTAVPNRAPEWIRKRLP